MSEHEDVLAQLMTERTERNPDFPRLVEAYRHNRDLLDALADKRLEIGLSQRAVADRMGTSQAAVDRLEAGEVDPKLSTIQRFAVALGLVIEWRLVTTPAVQELDAAQQTTTDRDVKTSISAL